MRDIIQGEILGRIEGKVYRASDEILTSSRAPEGKTDVKWGRGALHVGSLA